MDATDSESEEGVGAQMDATDSEGEGAADQARRTETGGDECAGGAAGGVIRKAGERQEATAIVLDKALKLYGKRIIVRDEAKKTLKGMAKAVLGRLLGRPPLSGSMDRDNVIRAIDDWLPKHGAVASALRKPPMLADLKAPRKTFKDQIKQLHPSCASGALTKLSTPGVEYVECILGCFCKEIVEELQSLAHGHGKTSSKKEESKKTITNDWLEDEALPALREPTLRLLLALEPRKDPAASKTSGTGGRAAVSGGEGATVSNMASVARAGGGSGAGGGATCPSTGEEGGVRDGHAHTATEDDDDAALGEEKGSKPAAKCTVEHPPPRRASREEGARQEDAARDASRANVGVSVTFSSEHLAHVLCAALHTKVAMKVLVRDVKAKGDAFRMVQQSSQADGAYTNMQIAETIAKCRPAQVSNASELLSWLVKEKLLKKDELRAAMATRSIQFVSRDKTDDLLKKIVTSWPHARPADAARRRGEGECTEDKEELEKENEKLRHEKKQLVELAEASNEQARSILYAQTAKIGGAEKIEAKERELAQLKAQNEKMQQMLAAQMGDSGLEGTATAMASQRSEDAGSPTALHIHPAGSASSRGGQGAAPASSSARRAFPLPGSCDTAGPDSEEMDTELKATFDACGLGGMCADVCSRLGVERICDLALVDLQHVKDLKLKPVEEAKLLRITGPSASDGALSRAKVTNLTPACRDPGNIDPSLERHAFLIGNGEYLNPDDKLFQPERDARKMGEALRTHAFKAEVFENQKKREMKDRFCAWRDQLPSTCVALLYCAGHGCEMDGENFFMPIDAPSSIGTRADAEDGCVSLAWMLNSILERLTRESLVIVLLDCCRDNPIKARGMRSRGTRGGQGLAEVKLSNSKEARLFVGYAAGPGMHALEGKQQHGEFTQALLKALESDMAREDIRAKFFGAVIDFVGQTTQQRQRPEFRCNMGKGFVFK